MTEAFNAVHLEAVRTAAEQAALRSSVATMFVNLARRSQILVDRLIGHLDRLERGEEDPDRLAELFQLDHLATRMRRNDENLLVLAGADSTRIQREPAALMDVLRAAQSEVEHYTRIEFGVIDQDIEVAAHAVNDLVHLVAELFDNATAFSPPDSHGHGRGAPGRRPGRRCYVEDRGIGMSPEQLAELNERLATPPDGGRGRVPDDGPGRGRPAGRPARRQGRAAPRPPSAGTVADVHAAHVGAGAAGAGRPRRAAATRAAAPRSGAARGPASRRRPALALESRPSPLATGAVRRLRRRRRRRRSARRRHQQRRSPAAARSASPAASPRHGLRRRSPPRPRPPPSGRTPGRRPRRRAARRGRPPVPARLDRPPAPALARVGARRRQSAARAAGTRPRRRRRRPSASRRPGCRRCRSVAPARPAASPPAPAAPATAPAVPRQRPSGHRRRFGPTPSAAAQPPAAGGPPARPTGAAARRRQPVPKPPAPPPGRRPATHAAAAARDYPAARQCVRDTRLRRPAPPTRAAAVDRRSSRGRRSPTRRWSCRSSGSWSRPGSGPAPADASGLDASSAPRPTATGRAAGDGDRRPSAPATRPVEPDADGGRQRRGST